VKREGTLYYDKSTDRYDIVYFDGGYYGGLSCGTVFQQLAKEDGEAPLWYDVRIEYNDRDGWVLFDYDRILRDEDTGEPIGLDGLRVRM